MTLQCIRYTSWHVIVIIPNLTCSYCFEWVTRHSISHLYCFEWVTHHSDQHIREDDDDSDVVEGKQEHPHPLHDRRRVTSAWKVVGVLAAQLLLRVLYFHAVDWNESKHRPEQTVQSPRQAGRSRFQKINQWWRHPVHELMRLVTHEMLPTCELMWLDIAGLLPVWELIWLVTAEWFKLVD